MTKSFSVTSYSIDKLKETLCLASHTARQRVFSKSHCQYFEEYLDFFKAKTILIEHDAYLKGNFPVVVGVSVFDMVMGNEIDRHAVTATGYSLGQPVPRQLGPLQILTKASRIDKLYAHDDQVGPFSRMTYDGHLHDIRLNDEKVSIQRPTLLTSLMGGLGTSGRIRAIPIVAFIPLYHKIRIPHAPIYTGANQFDLILRNTGYTNIPLEWDIYLTSVSNFKSDVIHHDNLSNKQRLDVLSMSMPRFMWRASAYHNRRMLVDFLFDATEIKQGKLLQWSACIDGNLASHATTILPIYDTHFGAYKNESAEAIALSMIKGISA